MIKLLCVALLAGALYGCGPSCSEGGGHEQFAYFMTTFIFVNNTPVPVVTAVYECIGGEE